MVQLIQFYMTIYASASFWCDGCQKHCTQISSISEVNCQQQFCSKLKQIKTVFLQIITGDETWIYQYDPKTKQQSKQWLPHGLSGPIKFKSESSVKKVMATVFWDSEGVVLVDFLEGKKTVTGTYYVEVLRKLRPKLAKKRPEKLHGAIISITKCPSVFFSDRKKGFERISVRIAATSTL